MSLFFWTFLSLCFCPCPCPFRVPRGQELGRAEGQPEDPNRSLCLYLYLSLFLFLYPFPCLGQLPCPSLCRRLCPYLCPYQVYQSLFRSPWAFLHCLGRAWGPGLRHCWPRRAFRSVRCYMPSKGGQRSEK